MERKTKQSTETTSILSLPQRSMIVWLLGKLSLLLGVALLVVTVLFALDLGTEPRRDESPMDNGSATAKPSRLPLRDTSSQSAHQHDRGGSGTEASPTALPDPPVLLYSAPAKGAATSSVPQGANVPEVEESQALIQAGQDLPELGYGAFSPTAMVQPTTPPSQAATEEAEPSTDVVAATVAEAVAETEAVASAPAPAGELAKTPVVTPSPTPTSDPEARPVQIRIPAIKVKRSVIGLPQIRDKKTGSWTQDLDVLFRKGRKDLVGHYEQSAQPGQEGNTILVGHNYGHGTKGVFLKLKRLKPGKRIEVVNATGQTFAYRVKAVHKVPWKSKGTDELLQHARLLALAGSERLTLVTCGGSRVQPFPARIYVVAEPIRD